MANKNIDEAASHLSSAFQDELVSRFDPADPTMAAHGVEKWRDQACRAAAKLEEKLAAAMIEIETELANGDFYRD